MIVYILIAGLAVAILANSWLIARLYLQQELDTTDEMGMGSMQWEIEALAKRIEELIPGLEWNRDEDGMILGIVHELEVEMKMVGDVGVQT